MIAGELEVELVPQGTLAERMRAGGYGLGRRPDPHGPRHGGRGRQEPDRGRRRNLPAGKAAARRLRDRPRQAADTLGNLAYSLTAQNFNPLMAMAADTVIVDAEDIVPIGVIPPDSVCTPGVLVDYLLARGA